MPTLPLLPNTTLHASIMEFVTNVPVGVTLVPLTSGHGNVVIRLNPSTVPPSKRISNL